MPASRSYSFGEYTLDLKRGALLRTGADVKLRPKSFEVLRLLIERHGQLVTKEELLNAVWRHAVVTDGAVGQCLVDLRRVIGDESQQFIRTVPRRGYIFDSPVVDSEDAAQPDNEEAHPSASPRTQSPVSLRRRALVRAALAIPIALVLAWGIWWGVTTRESADAPLYRNNAQAPHNSIAVLPFIDLSPEQNQQYFSDGVSEEILNLLAQAPDLQVIARTSSFSFKGRNADIAEIAAKLNVAHVLEGSVRKSGSRVRITAQLVDGANSAHLWSETYDRELQDSFAVQSDIAARVSEALKVTLADKQRGP
jgi:TolB-like protein/DNA-binding winged helix-turn-helix (wHTH) protein